jgi:hypothetical protein
MAGYSFEILYITNMMINLNKLILLYKYINHKVYHKNIRCNNYENKTKTKYNKVYI